MDFKDEIKALGERVAKLKDHILTEEATKNALILPFIQALGYDIFSPDEVVPEFVADVGIKKGEKVDYGILKDGQPIMLIECKWCSEDLSTHDSHRSQLYRYFSTTKARFAVLTNGVHYRFYADLVEPNKMDEEPFLEFDITEVKENVIEELKKFHKSYFDIEQNITAARELKYSYEIKTFMQNELANPTEPFVKFFANQIYKGKVTERVVKEFEGIVKKSLNQFINDKISDILKKAASPDVSPKDGRPVEAQPSSQPPWLADGKAWHLEKRCSPKTKEMLVALDQVVQEELGIGARWKQEGYVAYPVKNLNRLCVNTAPRFLVLDFLVKAGVFNTEELAKRLGAGSSILIRA